ncbi:amino acid adenylation domain-containing protein [Streptomyces umbrinus]|uniref:Amino acid adenylation domain-containing protein n=1 Tax=Streptomyces umbrinus TaxID=67370 RepID=A0ABU0SM92_9ACTN|nr:non-ribosomal peptide synthetase [Streptomyces umbrinus]MDQ1024653.1 amino acid adenylation domain-containing protein [Streptomyces umbrinus]
MKRIISSTMMDPEIISYRKSGVSMDKAAAETLLISRMNRAGEGSVISPREDSGPAPLSFAQQRLWFLDQLHPGRADYAMPTVFRLRGQLEVLILKSAFQDLVNRHESLRTRFEVSENGTPVQIVDSAANFEFSVIDMRLSGGRASRMDEALKLITSEVARPFDLSSGTLLRVKLVRMAPDEYLLLVSLHHIVADGWSMDVLTRDLRAFYSARIYGNNVALPDLKIQYADFASWQRQWLSSSVQEHQLSYWREKLADLEPVELQTDHPRPAAPSGAGDSVSFEVPAKVVADLRDVAARHGASLFMATLAAFKIVLQRWTGRYDISVGTPIAGRNKPEVENLIGFFVNTLLVRSNLGGDPTFNNLLEQVKETTLEAYSHQDLAFDLLVEDLAPERDLSRIPLVNYTFSFDEASSESWDLPGLTINPVKVTSEIAKFDLSVFLGEDDRGVFYGDVLYSTELFDKATVRNLADQYVRVLEGVAADPDLPISQIDVLGTAERELLLGAWNDTAVVFADELTVHELVERQVARVPGAVAVVCGESQLTYRELNARANQLARHLMGQGAGAGSLVAVCLERGPDMIIALLGILKAGAAYVPMDPDYPEQRLEFMLRDTHASLMVTQAALVQRFAGSGVECVLMDRDRPVLDALADADLRPQATPDALAYVIYTSGSTGIPKGVMIEHRSICRLVGSNWFAPLTSEDVVAQAASSSFDAFTFECWAPLVAGGSVAVLEKDTVLNSASLQAALRSHRVSVLFLTSALFNQHILDRPDAFAGVRRILYGGELVDQAVAVELGASEHGPEQLVHLYGPAETTVIATSYLVGERSSKGLTMPIGRPIANTEVYVMDEYGQLAPIGVPGELWIGGVGLARGYLNQPELTREKFVPHPFSADPHARLYRSGDRVRWLPDGNLEFVGRVDHQVKLRGLRIELGEIETVLTSHDQITAAVVMVREDTSGDKRLVAYIAPTAGADPGTPALRAWCKRTLPDYMVPGWFVSLPALPLTPNGKIDRKALPKPPSERPDLADTYTAPRNEIETAIADIWSDVLGIDRIGIHDNFFDLGGHSLLATRVINQISKFLNSNVPVRDLFRFPTIAGLAFELSAAVEKCGPPAIQRVASEEFALSFAQRRLWFLDQLEPGSPEYIIPMGFQIKGNLEIDALETALSNLVARHETLRTKFVRGSNGEPIQVVDAPWHVEISLLDLSAVPDDRTRATEARAAVDAEASKSFDLTSGRLLRSMAVRLAGSEWWLTISLHHIVADGWSLGVLTRELEALYEDALTGAAARLTELPVQYKDFAAWQNEWLSGSTLERHLAYWQEELTDLEPLELPTDRTRPPIRSKAGGEVSFVVPTSVAVKLRTVALERGASLFMVSLAVLQVVLSRWSGQHDISVATPISGRNQVEVENLVGFFVNTLIIRSDLSGNPTFGEFLEQVKETTLQAYTHQDLPYQKLVEALAPDRDLTLAPLVQTTFALQNGNQGKWVLGDLDISPLELTTHTSKFDLSVFLTEREDGEIVGNVEYSTELFDRATIERLMKNFVAALQCVADRPTVPLGSIDILSAAERELLLGAWNDTAVVFADELTVHELVERQVARVPGAVAVVCGESQLTYRELNARANQLARHLMGQGAGAGSLVAVCLERGPDMIIALLGILKAGAAYVPMDPDYPEQRLEFMLRDTHASLMVTQAALVQRFAGSGVECVLMDRDRPVLDALADADLRPQATPDALAYVIYTSGSTGIPKGVMIEHRSICRLVGSNWFAPLTSEDVVAQAASSSFDAFTFECWAPLVAGGSVAVLEKDTVLNSASLQAALRSHRVSVLFLTSALFNQHILDRPDAFAGVRRILYGGELVDQAVAVELGASEHGPEQLVHLYGPTETTTFATSYLVGERSSKGLTMPIGRPIANTEVYVMDEYGQLAPIGVPGELWIGGVGLARGYLNQPELTREKFVPHPFSADPHARLYRSGDRVRWLPDGNLEFVGRVDHQVKLRGLRIELGEIETVLTSHDQITAAVVMVREDTSGDKRLVAYIAPTAGADPGTPALRAWCKRTLPDYMVPGWFVSLPALPLTPNGKIDRKALPKPPSERPDLADTYTAPRNEIETAIADIWSDVLGIDRIGIHDNFFDLGGHSLRAVAVRDSSTGCRHRRVGTPGHAAQVHRGDRRGRHGATVFIAGGLDP